MSEIPYTIFDIKELKTTVDHGSASEDNLRETLLKELHICMEYHDFFDYYEESNLICDECRCEVVSRFFLKNVSGTKLCGACFDTTGSNIDDIMYNEFMLFLKQKSSICQILYFKNNEWIHFIVE